MKFLQVRVAKSLVPGSRDGIGAGMEAEPKPACLRLAVLTTMPETDWTP